jgi:glycosyltransferase involved in cell wall biosynthesis
MCLSKRSGSGVFQTMAPALSVIFSTYNQPDWLEKVLWGYACQTDRDFEIVVADDGSGPATRERIERARLDTGLNIAHVWHPDDGFQKSAILNKAISASTGDYLIFSDGDCVPRNDFVATHRAMLRPGWFLSGGYTKLSSELSRALTRDDIESGRAFDRSWLAARGLPGWPWAKHAARGKWARFLNAMTPTKPTWNGHNASGWKADLLRVNGFDERMQYGGQDRELGERLVNLGIRTRQIRHLAIVLHLDHPRGYDRPESIRKNYAIRRETVGRRLTWTPHGIVKRAQRAVEDRAAS